MGTQDLTAHLPKLQSQQKSQSAMTDYFSVPYDSLKLKFRSTPSSYILPEIQLAMG